MSKNFDEILKKYIYNALEASKPCEPCEGIITAKNPVTVKVTDKINLSAGNNLAILKGLDLDIGDKVLLIKAPKGQKYYLIGELI